MNLQTRCGAAILAASLLVGGTIFSAGTGYAASTSKKIDTISNIVTLKLNGNDTKTQGLFAEGKTWVPVTFLRDVLKMPVTYDSSSRTYSVGKDYRQLNLMVYSDGVATDLNGLYLNDAEARMVNGHLYIPFQWVKNYLGYQGDWSASTKTLNVIPSKENKLHLITETYNEDRKIAIIDLRYPQISNTGNVEAEKAINDVLKKDVEAFKDSIEKQLQELKGVEDLGISPYEYTSNYIVTYDQNGVLSLITQMYEYTGGAHGMTYRKAYTFSLSDGKLLSLDDLFGQNKNYEKQLNEQIESKLNAMSGYMGGFEKLDEQPDFYLQQGVLKIFFQLYEYTPYVSGFPEFAFSYNSLLPKGSTPFDYLNVNQ